MSLSIYWLLGGQKWLSAGNLTKYMVMFQTDSSRYMFLLGLCNLERNQPHIFVTNWLSFFFCLDFLLIIIMVLNTWGDFEGVFYNMYWFSMLLPIDWVLQLIWFLEIVDNVMLNKVCDMIILTYIYYDTILSWPIFTFEVKLRRLFVLLVVCLLVLWNMFG